MSLNETFPIPVACIAGSSTIDVDAVAAIDWPYPTPSLYLSISFDAGATWQPLAEFVPDVGQTVDAGETLTPGFLLRFEEPYSFEHDYVQCDWGVWADVDVVVPSGHHLEYTWSGDALNPNGGRAELPTSLGGVEEYTATVVVDLVRDSDDEIICTATDIWIEELQCPPSLQPPPDYNEIDFGNSAAITESCEVLPPVVLEVTLDPSSGCPGDPITATGSHNIISATIGGVSLTLDPTSGTVVSFVVPETIVEAGSYDIVFTTDAAIDTVTDTVALTVGSGCFPEPCTPPAPVACFDSLTTLKLSPVLAVDFPACTPTLTLQTKIGEGSWNDAQTGIVAETEYSIALSIASGMKARFVSEDTTAGAEIDLLICECEPIPPAESEIPEIPDAPTLSKNCTDTNVTVTSPAFVATGTAQTATIEIRRRLAPAGDWVSVHTFEAAGDWIDETVTGASEYDYSARACNASGCSEWSASATISLKSGTTVAIVSPATGTIAGKKRVRMSRSAAVTDPRLFWNGVLIGVPVWQDGFYIFDWDTLDSSQGAGTLRFQATGGDGCDNHAEIEYTLANPASALVQAVDVICREGVSPAGMRIKSSAFRFEAKPLPGSANQRYFLRAAAYLDDLAADDAFALEFNEDTWAQGQPLLMQEGRRLGDGTTQYTWFDILAKKSGVGQRAIFRLRWDIGEALTGFSTFGEGSGSRIVKFQPVGNSEDDDYRVLFLARKVNGTGARVYQFDGETVELLYDLADAPNNAPGAFDFALLGDKLFIAAGSELFYIDTDSGDASANLTPRGEARTIAHLAVAGSSIFALFNGEGDCRCYRYDGTSWKALWTLPVAVDKAYSTTLMGNAYLMLASGAELYTAIGTAVPALVETFGADITALHQRLIGLTDGKVYEFVLNDWLLRTDRTVPILAAAEFSGIANEIESPRGVAGENSDTLLEATLNPAVWTDNRTLAAPALMDETVTAVTALYRFLKQTSAAEGDPNMPGFIPAKYQEVLLIGTAPDGLLLMLEVSAVAQSPLAIEARKVGAMHAMPIHETIPIEG